MSRKKEKLELKTGGEHGRVRLNYDIIGIR